MNPIKSIKNMPKGVKSSIALFFASLISKGIAYITTPIFTRMLSPSEYGQVSVFLTWQNIFGIVAMFCLMNGVFNNGMVDYPEERDNYSFSMLILSNIITIIFSIIIFSLFPILNKTLNIELYQLILMCLIYFFQPAYSFWSARQRYELKYKKNVLWSIIIAIVSPVTAILLIFIFPEHRLKARIIGAEGSLILFYIGFYMYVAKQNSFKIDNKFWKAAFLFNLPLIPHYLSSLLLSSSDRVMISMLVSDEAAAYYSVAASIASVVLIVWNAVNSSLIPFTYEKCRNKNYESLSAVTLVILIVFALCCVILVLIAPELVKIMATSEYSEAIYVIPPLVGGVFFQVLYYVFSNIVYYYKKPVYVMVASIVATVLNLLLNYFLIRKYGYIAAAYTTIICYIVQASIDYLAMKKVVGKSIYNDSQLLLLSLCVVVFVLLSNILYKYSTYRYLVLAFVVICVVASYKRIVCLLKTLKDF